MSLRRFIGGLFSSGPGPEHQAPKDIAPSIAEWPLAEAHPIVTSRPAGEGAEGRPHGPSKRNGFQLFAYPFDDPEIAEMVQPHFASPEEGKAPDGKYCEVPSNDGTVRYVSCRALIEALQKAEGVAGRGLARVRLVALDRFGYTREAEALFREFEREMGAPMAAMGYARLLLTRHADRALEVIKSARQRGIGGAALAACHARVSFACGSPHEGVRMAAEALRSSPDPLWNEADHFYSWGLLHGAALASRGDSSLREEVLSAVRSLREGVPSARMALACASLAEAAGDLPAAAGYAADSLLLAEGDREFRAAAARALERLRSLPALVSRFSQPPGAMDTRRASLNIEGWSLDAAGSNAQHSRWRDRHGDEIILTAAPTLDLPDAWEIGALRIWCRQLAERNAAGLVEVSVIEGRLGLTVQMIYKKLVIPAFTFTGVQINPLAQALLTWEVVARERGTTGVREATVTGALFQQGRLDPMTYEEFWARDPYDPLYRGVQRSTLRYISDDPGYDTQFPGHPLSKVRRLLRALSTRSDLSMVVPEADPPFKE